MKKVLLHICCGVCALHAIDRLKEDGFLVWGLFFNPNIYPHQEYQKRLDSCRCLKDLKSIELIEEQYLAQDWLDLCQGFEKEPENGRRCLLCYAMRLERTYELAKASKFDCFTTTLTISPHKNSRIINEMGNKIGGDYFLACDFKKEDGFKKTIELAKQNNFYRQNYCGCVYSLTP
ncbi:MAG: epoxyqueuosine reductase QueH [Candidatus Omnitrophica bacterium]|nr:epoxyqueuosine reductase QueH [Candidatus Omnitrophota bacterium]